MDSLLGWWELAGVDAAVSDAPRDWLAPPRPASPAPEADASPRTAPASAGATALPKTLAAMQAYLASDPSLGSGARLAPEGDPASGLMLLIDAPEAEDAAAGGLLSGEVGRLFDRMLAAIGRDRASVYLAPLSPAHGHRDEAERRHLAAVARAHAALAQPKVLLLLGDAPVQAFVGLGAMQARGRLHEINHDGATLRAIATMRPRMLLERPQAKAHAWADLRLLMREMNR